MNIHNTELLDEIAEVLGLDINVLTVRFCPNDAINYIRSEIIASLNTDDLTPVEFYKNMIFTIETQQLSGDEDPVYMIQFTTNNNNFNSIIIPISSDVEPNKCCLMKRAVEILLDERNLWHDTICIREEPFMTLLDYFRFKYLGDFIRHGLNIDENKFITARRLFSRYL